MMKFVMIKDEGSDTQNKYQPVSMLEHDKPFNRHPLCCACLPETETDAHGAAEQKDDVPWNIFKLFDRQYLEYEEQKC